MRRLDRAPRAALSRTLRHAASAALALAALAALPACVGYANYPPIEGDTAANDPNAQPFSGIMVGALKYTIERHPVEGQYAVNLPEGMLRHRALQIIDRLDDPAARPMTPETVALPTYHVSRVWIRGTEAEVDVHRPLPVLTGAAQPTTHQMATLYMTSGFNEWRVERVRPYAMGAFPPPEPSFIPEPPPEPQPRTDEPDADANKSDADESEAASPDDQN